MLQFLPKIEEHAASENAQKGGTPECLEDGAHNESGPCMDVVHDIEHGAKHRPSIKTMSLSLLLYSVSVEEFGIGTYTLK